VMVTLMAAGRTTRKKMVDAGVSVRCYGWADFGCPTDEHMLKMVADMATETACGGRVLVHCHAGHGRTGLLIACWLVFDLNYTAAEAITLVRLRRAKAIQTSAQAAMIKRFAVYLRDLRTTFHRDGVERPVRTPFEELAINRSLVPTGEIIRLGHRHVFLDRVTGALVKLVESGGTLQPSPETANTITLLKKHVDDGAWEAVAYCDDAAALVDVISQWIQRFEPPVLHERITKVVESAAQSCDPSLIASAVSGIAEEDVGVEMVRCILAAIQAIHRQDAAKKGGVALLQVPATADALPTDGDEEMGAPVGAGRDPNPVHKLAIALAEAVKASSGSKTVGAEVIELSSQLADLAAVEFTFATFGAPLGVKSIGSNGDASDGENDAAAIVHVDDGEASSSVSPPIPIPFHDHRRSRVSTRVSLTPSFVAEDVGIIDGLSWVEVGAHDYAEDYKVEDTTDGEEIEMKTLVGESGQAAPGPHPTPVDVSLDHTHSEGVAGEAATVNPDGTSASER